MAIEAGPESTTTGATFAAELDALLDELLELDELDAVLELDALLLETELLELDELLATEELVELDELTIDELLELPV